MDYLQYDIQFTSPFYLFNVLNLVINGLPSIPSYKSKTKGGDKMSFKPCYKWITFNTSEKWVYCEYGYDLGFKPCYKWITFNTKLYGGFIMEDLSFKPCYKWITFNTQGRCHHHLPIHPNSFKPCYKWITFNTTGTIREIVFFFIEF